MRKAALLYNPLSGSRHGRRLADVAAAATVLSDAGVEIKVEAIRSQAEGAAQTRQAVAEGFDTILACGGDGTIHDVLQGLVGTGAVLGVIPLGTANALAHDLGLPVSPVGAARAALSARVRRLAVGRVEYHDFSGKCSSRFFTVAVGIGVDAHLFYQLNPLAKSRMGMAAYYMKATWLWLTDPLEHFTVEPMEPGSMRQATVSQLLAVRIRNFGGVLRELAPGAALEQNDLRLVLFRTQSRLAYLSYILRGLFGRSWAVPGIDLLNAERVSCRTLATAPGSRVFVEADGELLGTLPAEISMLPDALSLLAP